MSVYVCECVDRRLIFRDWLACWVDSAETCTQGKLAGRKSR